MHMVNGDSEQSKSKRNKNISGGNKKRFEIE